jgi:hypothetical protein
MARTQSPFVPHFPIKNSRLGLSPPADATVALCEVWVEVAAPADIDALDNVDVAADVSADGLPWLPHAPVVRTPAIHAMPIAARLLIASLSWKWRQVGVRD